MLSVKQTNIFGALSLCLLLLSSCIQENPDLVNPPLVVETVNVRFFNLSADKQSRSLWFDTKPMANNTPFNSVSAPERPPFDSVDVEVVADDNTPKYISKSKLKFGRLSNYILLTLPNLAPKHSQDTGFINTDTIVYLQSNTLQPDDTNKCYVKFLNANPDTAATYSIKAGCPSGEHLFVDNSITTVRYLQSTGTQAIYAGNPAISIIKNSGGNATAIGTFELTLERLGQYAIIINTNDEVYVFNELVAESLPELLSPVAERIANVRTVNLTTGPVSVAADAAGDLAQSLETQSISPVQAVSTCNSMNMDRIVLTAGGNTMDTVFASFDIYKNYTLLAFDAADAPGQSLVIVPPLSERTLPQAGMSTLRVVNGNYTAGGLTVSTGAHTAPGTEFGYSSGTLLSTNLVAGECSEPVYLSAGTVPVAAFEASQPSRYLFSGVVTIEAGKDYILAIDGRDSGKICVLESAQASTPVIFAPPAAFVQLANVTAGDITFDLESTGLSGMISAGRLSSGDLLSTFLPLGSATLQTGGGTLNITLANRTQRTLLVAAGSLGSLFALQGSSMNANGNLKWRIINAAEDCPVLNVLNIERWDTARYQGIGYQTASPVEQYHRDHKYSFIFQNAQTSETLYTSQDLLMTINKNYSIIFYGNARTGYRILILQEY